MMMQNEEYTKRTLALDCIEKIGQLVRVCGWVQVVRAHGKIAFIDLRDRSGVIQ
jgi:aspartyl-tRNA synthetase